MGHYDTQFEQDNEDKRKWYRSQLKTRLNNSVLDMSNEQLEKLVVVAEDWGSVSLAIDVLSTMIKIKK